MDEDQVKLIAEQLARFKEQLNSRVDRVEESLAHHAALEKEVLSAVKADQAAIKEDLKDHETRLRAVTDGVTTFKTWSGLASGGSTVLAVVAFVKALIGG